MGRRLMSILIGAVILGGALGVTLALRSGPGGARFQATAKDVEWLFGHSYVTFTATVTNVGGSSSTFECSSKIFGEDGVDVTTGPGVLAPGTSAVVTQVAAVVPRAHRHDNLPTIAGHLTPVCSMIPRILHVHVR